MRLQAKVQNLITDIRRNTNKENESGGFVNNQHSERRVQKGENPASNSPQRNRIKNPFLALFGEKLKSPPRKSQKKVKFNSVVNLEADLAKLKQDSQEKKPVATKR